MNKVKRKNLIIVAVLLIAAIAFYFRKRIEVAITGKPYNFGGKSVTASEAENIIRDQVEQYNRGLAMSDPAGVFSNSFNCEQC